MKLPHLLREATGRASEEPAVFATLSPLAQRRPLMVHSYRSFLPRALELGLTTPDEAARMETEWLQARGEECYVQSPPLVGAWVRREREPRGAS